MDQKYVVGKRHCVHPFVILEGGAILIYDELLNITHSMFSFDSFCNKFSKKYNVPLDVIREDVSLVLKSLEEGNNLNLASNVDFSSENTYQDAFSYYNQQNKIFKVSFELTYSCNLKCKHCYLSTDINSYKSKITFESAKKIIDQLHNAGVVDLTFTGGECFSNPDAMNIIRYACKYDFIICILTNGTLLTEKMIAELAQLPISSIRISLYGLDKYHDKFVGEKGAFERSMTSLRMLNHALPGLGMATSVITKDNVDDLMILNKKLKDDGINHKMTPLIFPTAKGDLSPTTLRIGKEKIIQLIQSGMIEITSSQCSSGISRLRIAPNGEVNPCELFRDVSFGNILSQPFTSIIGSEKRKNWIEYLRKQQSACACSNCSKRKYCPQCLGIGFLENGNLIDKPLTLCSLADAKMSCA